MSLPAAQPDQLGPAQPAIAGQQDQRPVTARQRGGTPEQSKAAPDRPVRDMGS
jgi:hypothetical protein